MELRNILLEYKEVTHNFINEINSDGNGADYLEKREILINKLKVISFSQAELKDISDEINLMEVEKKAFDILNDEKNKVKDELINLKKKKEANNSYGNKFGNINFLNKQI